MLFDLLTKLDLIEVRNTKHLEQETNQNKGRKLLFAFPCAKNRVFHKNSLFNIFTTVIFKNYTVWLLSQT